jgi:hypothetical protein
MAATVSYCYDWACYTITSEQVGDCFCLTESWDAGYSYSYFYYFGDMENQSVCYGQCANAGGGGGGNTESQTYGLLRDYRKAKEYGSLATGVTLPTCNYQYTQSGAFGRSYTDLDEDDDQKTITVTQTGSDSSSRAFTRGEDGGYTSRQDDWQRIAVPEGRYTDTWKEMTGQGSNTGYSNKSTTGHHMTIYTTKSRSPGSGTDTATVESASTFNTTVKVITATTTLGLKSNETYTTEMNFSYVRTAATVIGTGSNFGTTGNGPWDAGFTGTDTTTKITFISDQSTYADILVRAVSMSTEHWTTTTESYTDSYWRTTNHTVIEYDENFIVWTIKNNIPETGEFSQFYESKKGINLTISAWPNETLPLNIVNEPEGDTWWQTWLPNYSSGSVNGGKVWIMREDWTTTSIIYFRDGWKTSTYQGGFATNVNNTSTGGNAVIPDPIYYEPEILAPEMPYLKYYPLSQQNIFTETLTNYQILGAKGNAGVCTATSAKLLVLAYNTPGGGGESGSGTFSDSDGKVTRTETGTNAWGETAGGQFFRYKGGEIAGQQGAAFNAHKFNVGWAVLNKSQISIVGGVKANGPTAQYAAGPETRYAQGPSVSALQNGSTTYTTNNSSESRTISVYGGYVYYTTATKNTSTSSSTTSSESISEVGNSTQALMIGGWNINPLRPLGVPALQGGLVGGIAGSPNGSLTAIITPASYRDVTHNNVKTFAGTKLDYSYLDAGGAWDYELRAWQKGKVYRNYKSFVSYYSPYTP